MQRQTGSYQLINYGIASVWLINGLFCKVLNLVPRHQRIVSEILGSTYASLFTRLIGFSEILMAVWILSGFLPRLNVITQILLVLTMNTIEFFITPHLLLFGQANFIFALLFASLVYYNEFHQRTSVQLKK